ncbi:PEGA domain-containing protein [bacterium]|nr:MAG: PEGA domain-containing protein [bacterium]
MNTNIGLSGQILPDDMKRENDNNNNKNNDSFEFDPKWLKIIGILGGIIILGVVGFIVLTKLSNNTEDVTNKKVEDSQIWTGSAPIIDTTVGKALVTLDNKNTSMFTPFPLDGLENGEHSVWISNEKGDWKANVELENGGIKSISAVIENQEIQGFKKDGEILLSSDPIGAKVFFDDEQLDEITPLRIENLSPGNHKISLSLDGYYSWGEELTIESGTTKSFSAILDLIKEDVDEDERIDLSEFMYVNNGWRKFENLIYNIKGEVLDSWKMNELSRNDFALLYPDVADKAEYQDAEILIVFDDDQEDTEPVMTINISSLSEDQLVENMINFYGDQIEIEDTEDRKNLKTEYNNFAIISDVNSSYNFLISYRVREDTFDKFIDAFQILEDDNVDNIEELES